ncbi:MAG: hypothetical protein IPG96_12595 [Proteobacteria bacterium]|nr:hypothetical protein [Pseudomonadota bacterium]
MRGCATPRRVIAPPGTASTPTAAATVARRTRPPGAPATLADYWHGRASWELLRSYEPKAGNHISIVGEVWYLFSRTVHPGEICNGTERLGTEVRASYDHGVSWSAPVEILVPRDGTPWACAATDGDAIFDAATGTWHYLFQCLAKSGPWQGCHAQLRAADPTSGEFVAVLASPVIPAGGLAPHL